MSVVHLIFAFTVESTVSVTAFLLSGVVLGFTANFASLFLPHIRRTHRLYVL